MTVVGEPAIEVMYSMQCFIISLDFKDVPVYVIKDLMIIISPILKWLVFLFLWKIVFKMRLNKSVMVNSLSLITYYDYP